MNGPMAKLASRVISTLLMTLITTTANGASLAGMGADISRVTVSGISSGGYMATQFHVAHSSMVNGAGVLAAGPYDCAEGSLLRALSNCTSPDSDTPQPDPDVSVTRLKAYAQAGKIDSIDHLADDRAWIFSGGADDVVSRAVVEALAAFYRQLLPKDAVRFVALPDAGHAMISVASPNPNACDTTEAPYINRCGDFDAAGEVLSHLHGSLRPRGTAQAAHLHSFPQAPFAPGKAIDLSLAEEGMVYVPEDCKNGGCGVHIVFHGCLQGTDTIGTLFVEGAGYNEWAESNRLIILYPQIEARPGLAWGSWRWVFNPRGCWDWWGYTGNNYPTQEGGQVRAVYAMLEKLAAPHNPK